MPDVKAKFGDVACGLAFESRLPWRGTLTGGGRGGNPVQHNLCCQSACLPTWMSISWLFGLSSTTAWPDTHEQGQLCYDGLQASCIAPTLQQVQLCVRR